jgi:hypothetical protein
MRRSKLAVALGTTPSRLDDDFLGQVNELLVRRGSVDEGEDCEAPRALERRQRMAPGVGAIIYAHVDSASYLALVAPTGTKTCDECAGVGQVTIVGSLGQPDACAKLLHGDDRGVANPLSPS